MSISRPTDGMGVFCTRCNAEMSPDETMCPSCGEPRLLATDIIPRTEETVVTETIIDEPAPVLVEEDPRIPPWLAALLGVLATLVLVLLIIVFAQSDDDGPSSTTTTAPTTVVTVPPATAPSIVTIPVPVVVTPPPTQPPATSPPTTQPPATTAP